MELEYKMAKTNLEKPIYESCSPLIKEQYSECIAWHTKFLEEKNVPKSKAKAVLQALVECYQNILSHANQREKTFINSIKTYYNKKTIRIETSNYIHVLKKERLNDYLLLLETKNKNQLKQIYTKRLLALNKSPNQSTSMGLVVIFLIASQPPEFKFIQHSVKYYKFVLNLSINLENGKLLSSSYG